MTAQRTPTPQFDELRRMGRVVSKAASDGIIPPMRANDLLIAGFCDALLRSTPLDGDKM
jgi:hypothetical protein